MRIPLGVILLFACGVALAAPHAPRVQVLPNGSTAVLLNPSLLEVADVKKHVMSGLTMNLLLAFGERKPSGRLAIRFEPWEEVFFVSSLGHDGSEEKKKLDSWAELKEWWSAPRLPLPLPISPGERLKISVSVIPFSASEEADVKRWLARSLAAQPPVEGADALARSGVTRGGGSSLFSAVIASSIRRRPVLRFQWEIAVERAGR